MTGNGQREGGLAEFVERALTEVCFGGEEEYPLEPTVARYFHPEYRQRVDGEVLGYDAFVAHLRLVRTRVAPGSRVEVHEALRDGARIADRHTVHVVKPDGGRIETEVYLFGEFADDQRLLRVDEVSRMVSGGAEDADLGSAR